MPEGKLISWVHGSSMQVQNANRLADVRYRGPYGRILGAEWRNAWVHFPVPSPVLMDGSLPRAGAVLLSFHTTSHAAVYEVHVHDGGKLIAEHKGLNLQGEHPEARLEIPGSPLIQQAINISIAVQFISNAPDANHMRIDIMGAGVEFMGR